MKKMLTQKDSDMINPLLLHQESLNLEIEC